MKSIILILLLACSTIKKEDCPKLDWYGMGVEHIKSGDSKYPESAQKCLELKAYVGKKEFNEGAVKTCREYDFYGKAYEYGKEGRYSYQGLEQAAHRCKGAVRISSSKLKTRYEAGVKYYCGHFDQRNQGLQGKDFPQKCIGKINNSIYLNALQYYCSYETGFAHGLKDEDENKTCSRYGLSQYALGHRAALDKKEHDRRHREIVAQNFIQMQKAQGNRENKKCSFGSDCELRFSCTNSSCSGSGLKCSFDSDCSIKGSCQENACRY